MKIEPVLPSEEADLTEHQQHAGSPSPGEPVFLVVGKLRRAHGVHGEMVMDIITDFPERLKPHRVVFVGEEHRPEKIASRRPQNKAMLIRFEGYQNPEDVAVLRNQMVYIKAEELPVLPEGEFYHHQLMGLTVVDENHQVLGELVEILQTAANDVYVVLKPEGEELLLPVIESVVLEINLEKREISVRPPEYI